MHDKDRELTRRMLQGDERAFSEFFDTCFPRLYRFALSRLKRNADAAEEIAQEALCKAITKLASYRGEAALFTWVCTFCRHEISAYYRKHKQPIATLDFLEDAPAIRSALIALGAEPPDPTANLDRRELADWVQATLDHLPPHYGNALEWKYLDDLPVKEIAIRLDLTPKAAESLLTRARGAFRDAFRSLGATHASSSTRLAPVELSS